MNVFSLRASDVFAAATTHSVMPPPPAVVPVPMPHLEGARLSFACPLFEKLSPNVTFEGARAVLRGHDTGFGIPHATAMPTPLLAVHIAFSGCKALFGKARVLVNGTPAAWHLPVAAGLQVCSDPVPLPIGLVPSVLGTTVQFGYAADDHMLGMIDVLVDQTVSRVLRSARSLGAKVAGKAPYERFVQRLADQLAGRGAQASRVIAGLDPLAAHLLASQRAWLQAGIGAALDKGIRTEAKKLVGKLVTKAGDLPRGGIAADLRELFEPDALEVVPLLEGGT